MFGILPLLAGPAIRPPHQFDLKHVKFDVSVLYKTESLAGVVENTVITKAKNAVLNFDKGPMTIRSVRLPKSIKFTSKITKDHVVVTLKNVPAGKEVKVSIDYMVEPEAGLYFVPQNRAYPAMTDVAYTQGEMEDNRYWLPTYDFPDDKATTEGTFRVPKGFSVLSNGKLISKADTNTESIWKWKMDLPISTYLISFVAGRYTAVPDGNFKGKPIEIWTPTGLESWGKASFGGTDKIVVLYSKLTGVDYPWQKYAQSFVPEFMFGGMENASCTTQTIGALTPPNARPDEADDGLNAHELAHQWFGDLITTTKWDHIWVNEGWATFMPHFWTRQKLGEDAFHISRFGTYQGAYFSALSNPMVRSDYNVPMEMFDGNAYPGGATRMFMLMHMVGEETFWKACQKYLQKHGYKNLDTNDFFQTWGQNTNRNLEGFKKQWFYTKGAPKVSVKKIESGYEVIQETEGFTIPLEYVKVSTAGITSKGKMDLEPKKAQIIATESAETILLDPGAWLMAAVAFPNYTDQEWKLAWNAAENAAGKMRILQSIGDKPKLVQTLFKAEKSDHVRNQMISYLQDTDMLIELSKSSNRTEAFTATQNLYRPKNEKVGARMKEIFETTKDESLKETAYSNLLAAKDDEATANLGWNTSTYSLRTKTAALNWYATKDVSKARSMALEAVYKFAPGPVRMTAISVLGRVKDAEGSREVFNLLVKLAKGRPYAPMSAAIEALATYGDKAAIPVIESRKNHSLHFGRNTVESALARLNRP